MNQTYKQMIVMLFSVAFICIVAIMVLSSSAAAQETHSDRTRDMLQSADDHLAEQKPHVTATFSDGSIPTQHQTPYFDDEPVVYDSDRYEIDRMQDDIADLQDKQMAANGYDSDFSDRITDGIYALIIIAIIAFILYCIFGDFTDVPKPHAPAQPYIPDTPDTDTPDAQPYDRRAAQAEIEKEWR